MWSLTRDETAAIREQCEDDSNGHTLVSVTHATICIITQQPVSIGSHDICMVKVFHRRSPDTWPVKLHEVVMAQVQTGLTGSVP